MRATLGLADRHQSRCTSPWYVWFVASVDNVRKGVPGSISVSIRSRTNIFLCRASRPDCAAGARSARGAPVSAQLRGQPPVFTKNLGSDLSRPARKSPRRAHIHLGASFMARWSVSQIHVRRRGLGHFVSTPVSRQRSPWLTVAEGLCGSMSPSIPRRRGFRSR